MENYSNSSYPDSQNSSPRSREIDCENQSWDEPISNYKVKFMCSYGGKIQPRPHDNQLSYIGGDTKILSVDRNIKFGAFIGKLSSLCDSDVCFKYQLPGEDLDALISVTNDEDLEHMMVEYDRLYRGALKPARLRLFLFTVNQTTVTSGSGFDSGLEKSDQEWFVEALNSAPALPVETSVPVVAANPDFLFGFDKGAQPVVVAAQAPVVSVVPVDSQVRGGEAILSQGEIQRQINELQRMQVSGQEQIVSSQQNCTTQKVAENLVQTPQGLPVQMPVYWQNQSQMTGGGYQVAATSSAGADQQVYIIPTPGAMYQASTNYMQMTGQVNQPQVQTQSQTQAQAQGQQVYYGTQRTVPDIYREQQLYSNIQVPTSISQPSQQPAIGMYADSITGRQATESGYAIAYDGTGRQVYYNTTGGGAVTSAYQVVSPSAAASAPIAQVGVVTQDGKVAIAKPN